MSDSDKLSYAIAELREMASNYFFDQFANAETSADIAERVVGLLKELDKDAYRCAVDTAKINADYLKKEFFVVDDSPIEEHEHWYVNGHDTGIRLEDAQRSNFDRCPICR